MSESKVILNVKVADYLIKKGNEIKAVKPSTRVKGKVAFIFSLTYKLERDLSNYDPAKQN